MNELERVGAELTIDLSAVRQNFRSLSNQLKPGIELAAVVKADAYGLGVKKIVPVLTSSGCRTFFVSTLDEGVVLRELDENVTIFILNGLLPGQIKEYINNRLYPVLNTMDQIDYWQKNQNKFDFSRYSAALHLDTGMNRYGISQLEISNLVSGPHGHPSVSLLMSHLACADEPTHPLNAVQLSRFHSNVKLYKSRVRNALTASLANSSGIFLGSEYHFNMVRVGAALFGINPTPSHSNPMSQVVNLKAKIAQVAVVDTPMTVGYGASHRVQGPTRVATVPVGYADGYIRSLSCRGCAFIGKKCVPVIGRVSMDAITVDVSSVPLEESKPGTTVHLIGGPRPIDDVAKDAGTIGYEILTRLSNRIPRNYLWDSE